MMHSLSSLAITLSSLQRLSQDYWTLFRWQQSPVGSAHSYSCCCWNSTMLVAAFGFDSPGAHQRTTFNVIAPNFTFTNKRIYHNTLRTFSVTYFALIIRVACFTLDFLIAINTIVLLCYIHHMSRMCFLISPGQSTSKG